MAGTAAFISRVCGKGIVYLGWRRASGTSAKGFFWAHQPFEEPVDLVARASQLNRSDDVYFTPAVFIDRYTVNAQGQQASFRQIENVAAIKSFYVDVDTKQYDDAKAAATAIADFVRNLPFAKPTVIVASGGGFHLYWTMTEPVTPADWRPVAGALAKYAKSVGLKLDSGVTVNSASLLRLPGTKNFKYPDHPECQIVGWASKDIEFETFRQGLAGYTDVTMGVGASMRGSAEVVALFGGAQNSDLSAGAQAPKPDARIVLENCPTLAAAVERGGDGDSYDFWRNMLHFFAFCDGGREVALEASEKDPRFTEEGFDQFFAPSLAIAQAGTKGPTTCEAFSLCSEAKCQGCPHFNKIKSPIVLGRRAPVPAPVAAIEQHGPTYVKDGWTYLRRVKDGEQDDVLLTKCALDDFELGSDLVKGKFISFAFRTGVNSTRVTIYTADLAESRAIHRECSKRGIGVFPAALPFMVIALTSWMERLMSMRSVEDTAPFGWDDKGGFSIAGRRFSAGAVPAQSGSCDPVLGGIYKARGSFDEWRALAKLFEQDSRPEVHAVMASAFAAPLLAFVPNSAFVLAHTGERSGDGKTSYARVAASVFADPFRSMNSPRDTFNAVQMKLTGIRYLPAFWDELRGASDMDNFCDVMFSATQGVGKQRLRRSTDLAEVKDIATILCVSANLSVTAAVRERTGNSPAGLYRMLELDAQPIGNQPVTPEAFGNAISSLRHCHGTAGEVYVQKLVEMRSTAMKAVHQALETLRKRLGATEEERFWMEGSAAIIAGAALANKLDIIKIDVAKVAQAMQAAVERQRKVVNRVVTTIESPAPAIYNYFQGYTLVTKRDPMTGRQRVMEQLSGRSAKIVLDLDNLQLIMPLDSIREYSVAKKQEFERVLAGLTKHSNAIDRRMTPGSGTPHSLGQCRVMVMNAVDALGVDALAYWA